MAISPAIYVNIIKIIYGYLLAMSHKIIALAPSDGSYYNVVNESVVSYYNIVNEFVVVITTL
jgi:hypothetical protein